MTVDVEDYFHATAFDRSVSRQSWSQRESRVERNTLQLLEFLHQHRVRATFFVLGWVAQRSPGLVGDIRSAGHEIASHGFHHQLVYTLTVDQFREDVRRAKATIEDAGGCIVPAMKLLLQPLHAARHSAQRRKPQRTSPLV